jgi:peptidoglycan hydrolase-like protein with peptidoglycan-binding domain
LSLHKPLVLKGSLVGLAVLLVTFCSQAGTAFAATRAATTPLDPYKATMPTASLNGCPPSLANGSSGTWVQVLQFRLNQLHQSQPIPSNGYTWPLATDGIFGSQTEAAVKDTQAALGLRVDGQVGPNTRTILGFCAAGGKFLGEAVPTPIFANCPPTLQEGGNNNLTWVKALQSRLNYEYFATVHNISFYFLNTPDNFSPYLSVDGQFGSLTRAAVIDMQNWAGVSQSGATDQRTWSNLGLCYGLIV